MLPFPSTFPYFYCFFSFPLNCFASMLFSFSLPNCLFAISYISSLFPFCSPPLLLSRPSSFPVPMHALFFVQSFGLVNINFYIFFPFSAFSLLLSLYISITHSSLSPSSRGPYTDLRLSPPPPPPPPPLLSSYPSLHLFILLLYL